jgi:hypothetical protein
MTEKNVLGQNIFNGVALTGFIDEFLKNLGLAPVPERESLEAWLEEYFSSHQIEASVKSYRWGILTLYATGLWSVALSYDRDKLLMLLNKKFDDSIKKIVISRTPAQK